MRSTVAKQARQQKLFYIYLRDQGRCKICGGEVSPDEAALKPDAVGAPDPIYELRHLRLTHSSCRNLSHAA